MHPEFEIKTPLGKLYIKPTSAKTCYVSTLSSEYQKRQENNRLIIRGKPLALFFHFAVTERYGWSLMQNELDETCAGRIYLYGMENITPTQQAIVERKVFPSIWEWINTHDNEMNFAQLETATLEIERNEAKIKALKEDIAGLENRNDTLRRTI